MCHVHDQCLWLHMYARGMDCFSWRSVGLLVTGVFGECVFISALWFCPFSLFQSLL